MAGNRDVLKAAGTASRQSQHLKTTGLKLLQAITKFIAVIDGDLQDCPRRGFDHQWINPRATLLGQKQAGTRRGADGADNQPEVLRVGDPIEGNQVKAGTGVGPSLQAQVGQRLVRGCGYVDSNPLVLPTITGNARQRLATVVTDFGVGSRCQVENLLDDARGFVGFCQMQAKCLDARCGQGFVHWLAPIDG